MVFRRPTSALLFAAALAAVGACGADSGVVTIGVAPAPTTTDTAAGVPDPPGTSPPTSSPRINDPVTPASSPENTVDPAPGSTAPPDSAPTPTTLPPILEPEIYADIPISDVVDVGEAKPSREYDGFVAAALTDVEEWLHAEFPAVYGESFEPIGGGVFAGYPGRNDIPGCGEPTTSYQELTEYAAFYCQFGDFMAYDDGDGSLLVELSDAFGPAVMGIVLAHEYGHAVQQRIGAFDDPLPTIVTEQQADCFAGAWAGRAYGGRSALLRLGDKDLRSGLIAMVEVRDPVGLDQFTEGGHGSAFDRVGAFQEGFVNGLARCAELLGEPLTLMPNQFQRNSLDEFLGGNAPYNCSDLPVDLRQTCVDEGGNAPVFIADDLNDYWSSIETDWRPLSVIASDSFDSFACPDEVAIADEVVYCPQSSTVVYDEPKVLDMYRSYGDFTLGYFYGVAWADVAQTLAGSGLTGESRALLDDCWTGAWVRDITPDDSGTVGRPDSGVAASPGDLDEAIQTAILIGDIGANVNVLGSPFEKIEAFRAGVLGGLDACRSRFGIAP